MSTCPPGSPAHAGASFGAIVQCSSIAIKSANSQEASSPVTGRADETAGPWHRSNCRARGLQQRFGLLRCWWCSGPISNLTTSWRKAILAAASHVLHGAFVVGEGEGEVGGRRLRTGRPTSPASMQGTNLAELELLVLLLLLLLLLRGHGPCATMAESSSSRDCGENRRRRLMQPCKVE